MTMVHEVTLSWVHKVTFFLVYKSTFPAVRIETMKAIISFRVNIKPTRPTTFISRIHQVYRVFQDHQEASSHPTG